MARVDVPLFQPIEMRIDGGVVRHQVQVLDSDVETFLLRVPPDALGEDSPTEVLMSYGHKNFFWEVPAEARAIYDHWWFVERPDELECRRYQRRAFVRIAFKSEQMVIPAAKDEEGAMPTPVTTTNLSAGGALVTSPMPLGAPGDDVTVFLSLPEQAPIPTTSRIVRVQERGRYGLQFRDMHEDAQEQVAHFIAKQIQQSLTRGHDITEHAG